MTENRATRRRAPREEHRAQRHLDQIAKRLERGYQPPPQHPRNIFAKLERLLRGRAGNGLVVGTSRRRTPFTGNPPGRLATRRRLQRTRR